MNNSYFTFIWFACSVACNFLFKFVINEFMCIQAKTNINWNYSYNTFLIYWNRGFDSTPTYHTHAIFHLEITEYIRFCVIIYYWGIFNFLSIIEKLHMDAKLWNWKIRTKCLLTHLRNYVLFSDSISWFGRHHIKSLNFFENHNFFEIYRLVTVVRWKFRLIHIFILINWMHVHNSELNDRSQMAKIENSLNFDFTFVPNCF